MNSETQYIFSSSINNVDSVKGINNWYFVSGGENGVLELWTSSKKKPVTTLENLHNKKWILSLGNVKNSDLLVSGSVDNYINIYNINLDIPKISIINQIYSPGSINNFDFSKDGSFFISSVGSDQRLGRWVNTGKTKPGIVIYKRSENSK